MYIIFIGTLMTILKRPLGQFYVALNEKMYIALDIGQFGTLGEITFSGLEFLF